MLAARATNRNGDGVVGAGGCRAGRCRRRCSNRIQRRKRLGPGVDDNGGVVRFDGDAARLSNGVAGVDT